MTERSTKDDSRPTHTELMEQLTQQLAAAEEQRRRDIAELPSLSELFLGWPLYRKFALKPAHEDWYSGLANGLVGFDAFCLECGDRTPFKGSLPDNADNDFAIFPPQKADLLIDLVCQRKGHVYRYYFAVRKGNLSKIGQHPSLEDIAASDIEKYRKVLGKEYFSELHRAGGLASYGIGIGAFVYLRRIFERLIHQHKDEYDPIGEKLPQFAAMRMDEKVEALKSVLPSALVRNKAAYAILSKGLHELTEEECSKHFPIVRAAVILMLEQDYQQAERERFEADLEEQIRLAAATLASER